MTDGPNDDSDVTNDETGSDVSVGVGDVDILRFDPSKDVPVFSSSGGAAYEAYQKYQEEGDWGELNNIAAATADLGLNAAGYLADPLNFLIGAGLGFLIDVIQPLEDALGLVTGNPERMEGEIAKWERVEKALQPLSEEIRSAANDGLVTWEGKAADAAKTRINLFADGVAATGNEVKQIVFVLNIAKTVMDIAQSFVLSLIATFIEWLVYTWVPALAAAPATFGGSTAAAGAATGVQTGVVSSRLSAFVTRVVNILKRLRLALTRMHRFRMQRVQTTFQMRNAGRFADGWLGSQQVLMNSLKDWRTYLGTAQKSGSAVVGEVLRDRDDGAGSTDPDDALDPNR